MIHSKGTTLCETGRDQGIFGFDERVQGQPYGLAVNGSDLAISDSVEHVIRRFPLLTQQQQRLRQEQRSLEPNQLHPTAVPFTGLCPKDYHGYKDGEPHETQFAHPIGTAYDRRGNLFVADSSNHVIRKIDRFGNSKTFAGFHLGPQTLGNFGGHVDGNALRARFKDPRALALDRTGNIYVADTGNHVIRKITPAREVTTIAGRTSLKGDQDGPSLVARFRSPNGIAVDRSGTVYISDSGNHCIKKLELVPEALLLSHSKPNANRQH
mmetsp:Transcript_1432/g.2275  ORF Transcript_1432/g.2275 Transcript_1432/m.2275 type:complete len:267 (-) Transcript_1432:122-922(-)